MKNLHLLSLLLLLSPCFFAQSPNRRQVNTNNARFHFLKMEFVNDTLGYANTYGELLISVDGGDNWNTFFTVNTSQNFAFQNMYRLADSIYFFAHENQTDSNYTIAIKNGLTNIQLEKGYDPQPS